MALPSVEGLMLVFEGADQLLFEDSFGAQGPHRSGLFPCRIGGLSFALEVHGNLHAYEVAAHFRGPNRGGGFTRGEFHGLDEHFRLSVGFELVGIEVTDKRPHVFGSVVLADSPGPLSREVLQEFLNAEGVALDLDTGRRRLRRRWVLQFLRFLAR